MELITKWREVINNPFLHNLPFKIEQKRFGQIQMEPASYKQVILQYQAEKKLNQNLGNQHLCRKRLKFA